MALRSTNFRTATSAGFSLLETIVALAIFVGAAAILNELLQLGLSANQDHRLRSAALLHAESKLDEFAAGLEPLTTSAEPRQFSDAPNWQWTAEVSPTTVAGLLHVRIRVEHLVIDDEPANFSLELERWLAVPFAPENAAELVPPVESNDRGSPQ